jgi:hypothetical protein
MQLDSFLSGIAEVGNVSFVRLPAVSANQQYPVVHRIQPLDTALSNNCIILQWNAQLLAAPFGYGRVCKKLNREQVACMDVAYPIAYFRRTNGAPSGTRRSNALYTFCRKRPTS